MIESRIAEIQEDDMKKKLNTMEIMTAGFRLPIESLNLMMSCDDDDDDDGRLMQQWERYSEQ